MNVARTALVVDDSVSMRQMVAFTLGRAGFEVLEAANGQEALALAGELQGVRELELAGLLDPVVNVVLQ
jgi:two-component system chemotaxis response regulator CheY